MKDDAKDLSQLDHRRVIGTLGLLLPVLIYVIAGFRPTEGLPRWHLLDAVSDYYYTGAVAVFVGVLFALSLFLFTYPGYKGVIADRVVGAVGGFGALFVALFPTSAPSVGLTLGWWTKATGIVHYLSAVTMFVSFILFSLWLFRRSDIRDHRDRPPDKRRRNRVFLVCGLVMVVAVLWAGSPLFTNAPIFWAEALAIEAFAISWLVKGEAHKPIVEALRRRARAAPPDPVREVM